MTSFLFSIALSLLALTYVLAQLARIPLPSEVAIIALDVSMAVVVSGGVLYMLWSKNHSLNHLTNNPLWKPLMLFLGVGLVSLLSNAFQLQQNQLLIALLYFLRLGVYYAGFLLFSLLNKDQKKYVQNVMVFSGCILVLLGYVQLFLYPDMRNLLYLGWDDHYYRMVGTFLDPNFFGLFLVFYLFLLISKGREEVQSAHKKPFYFYVSLSLLTFIAIFLTYSRTALVALLVGMAVYLFFLKKVTYLIGFGAVTVLLVGAFANTQYESLNPFRTASITARLIASQKAVTIIQENPILGVGYNAYRYALEREGFSEESTYPHHGEAGTDNSFLFITATTGLVGLGFFLYLWGKIFYLSRSNAVLLASLSSFFIGSLFINALFYPFLLLWIVVLFSLTLDNQQ